MDPSASPPSGGHTAVLGLGNPILSDDGVGLAVAAAVQRRLAARPVPGVDVLFGTRAGFELIDLLQGYARAIIVDSLDLPAPEPGRVRHLGPSGVAGSARLMGSHDLSLDLAFRLAAQLSIPMPSEVEILGVETADLRTFREGLTPAVEAAVEPLALRIHQALRRGGLRMPGRAPASEGHEDASGTGSLVTGAAGEHDRGGRRRGDKQGP